MQLARGNGIKVVNKWAQIPKNAPMIVQRYIARPHLINGTKYDLRIYVLVTSINPLVVYLYDEGLVRFASNKERFHIWRWLWLQFQIGLCEPPSCFCVL